MIINAGIENKKNRKNTKKLFSNDFVPILLLKNIWYVYSIDLLCNKISIIRFAKFQHVKTKAYSYAFYVYVSLPCFSHIVAFSKSRSCKGRHYFGKRKQIYWIFIENSCTLPDGNLERRRRKIQSSAWIHETTVLIDGITSWFRQSTVVIGGWAKKTTEKVYWKRWITARGQYSLEKVVHLNKIRFTTFLCFFVRNIVCLHIN